MSDINTKDFAKAVEDQVIGWRRELHQCPELGMKTVCLLYTSDAADE